MKCVICKSTNLSKAQYNYHRPSLKGFLKSASNYLRPLISKKLFPKLSSKLWNPFQGTVEICKQCGYGVMVNVPLSEDLLNYYKFSYWNNRQVNNAHVNIVGHLTDTRANYQVEFVINYLRRNITKLTTLEIGAGPAYSSLLLREKWDRGSIDLYVCEPGEQWNKHYDFHSIVKIADFFPFNTAIKYNYIHTSHWLEHIINLPLTIRQLYEMLEENGYVFVEVPNCGHSYWNEKTFDTPHIHFFTIKALQLVFEHSKFKCINIEESGLTVEEWVAGQKITEKEYGKRDGGFWIRALFKK